MFTFLAAFMKLAFIKNIGLGISLAAPIGPLSVEIIKRGIRHGFMAAFIVCLGGAVGDLIYLVITYFGLSSVVSIPAVGITTLMGGAFVLLYLGFQSIMDVFKKSYIEQFKEEDKIPVRHGLSAFLLGIFLATANPMSIAWWVGIFGGAMSSDAGATASLLSYSTIIVGVLIWSVFLSLLLAFGKRFVNDITFKIISVVAGSSLVGYGLFFIYKAAQIFFKL